MIKSTHIHTKLTDYVLGLLPRHERQVVEQHLAHCAACEHALQQERKIGANVRHTLQQVGQPTNGRFRQLMPAIPQKKSFRLIGIAAQRQLAAACAVSLLLLIGWGWVESRQQPILAPLPTAVAVTATYTTEPTITTSSINATGVPLERAINNPSAAEFSPTPPPHPTPVAAVSAASN